MIFRSLGMSNAGGDVSQVFRDVYATFLGDIHHSLDDISHV